MAQGIIRSNMKIDADLVYNLRRTGATLQEIGDRLGRSKERIRQILVKNYGSTECKLLSTEQLADQTGFSRYQIMKMFRAGVIAPERGWETGCGRYLLWPPVSVAKVQIFEREKRLCKICGGAIPKGRSVCCSQECLDESRKYKHKRPEVRQRHLERVRQYKLRKKAKVELAAAKLSTAEVR